MTRQKPTILLIDDQDEVLTSAVDMFSDDFKLKTLKPKTSFQNLFEEINSAQPDLILMDLNLSEATTNYRAGTIAQEIRTRGISYQPWEVPICLYTLEEIKKSRYNPDNTLKDLFDIVLYKEDYDPRKENFVYSLLLLKLLINTYSSIKSFKRDKLTPSEIFIKSLNLKKDDNTTQAFLADVQADIINLKRPHEWVRFILYKIIDTANYLVEEQLVAARLGANIKHEDFSKNIEVLVKKSACKYQGFFSEYYTRYWWKKLETYIEDKCDISGGLRRLTAQQRIEIINKTFKLTFVAADPIEGCKNTRFWTTSEISGSPLDFMDGVNIIEQREHWQNPRYISIIEAKREGKSGLAKRGIYVSENDFKIIRSAR